MTEMNERTVLSRSALTPFPFLTTSLNRSAQGILYSGVTVSNQNFPEGAEEVAEIGFQKSQVQFPAPTQFTISCNSSST